MKMTRNLAGLLLICGCFFAAPLRAQPSPTTAVQQQQTFQQTFQQQQPLLRLHPGTNAPELYPGENADVGPQHILRLLPQRTYFMLEADSRYLYSDNVFFNQHPVIPGTEWVNTIEAAVAPSPYIIGPGRFSPAVGVQSQWYNYEMGNHDFGAIDFNVQTAFASVKYQFPRNWTAFAEFDYNRFVSQANYDEFYHEFVPSAGVQRLFQVTHNSLLAVTLEGDYHSTWQINPPNNGLDRADGIFDVSYAWQVVPNLVVQPYYRFQFTRLQRYDPVHNTDELNSWGLSIAYYFTPSLSLRVLGDYDINLSDDPQYLQKYHMYDFGAELTYTFRF